LSLSKVWNFCFPVTIDAAGVYVYTITAHSSVNAGVFEFNGTVTVLY